MPNAPLAPASPTRDFPLSYGRKAMQALSDAEIARRLAVLDVEVGVYNTLARTAFGTEAYYAAEREMAAVLRSRDALRIEVGMRKRAEERAQ